MACFRNNTFRADEGAAFANKPQMLRSRAVSEDEASGLSADRSHMRRCVERRSITEELYSGPVRTIGFRDCCDRECGYSECREDYRCPYWPDFAHPRWLSCNELYDCCRIPLDSGVPYYRRQRLGCCNSYCGR